MKNEDHSDCTDGNCLHNSIGGVINQMVRQQERQRKSFIDQLHEDKIMLEKRLAKVNMQLNLILNNPVLSEFIKLSEESD